jgi:hypothetical protein
MDTFDIRNLEGEVGKDINPTFTGKNIGDVVSAVLPYLFAGAGLILLLYLIFGGLSLMLSRGDPKAVQAAKDKITTAY